MPTIEHNAMVEMYRENPELAPHLLALLFGVDVPPHASVGVVESSLDQLIPVEFRADLVLELRDARGALVLAIVLEAKFPPFVQRIFEQGIHEGELKGELKGKRDTLLRLLAHGRW